MSYEAQEALFSENIFILARPLSSITFIEGLNSFQLARIKRLELYARENDALCEWSHDPEKIQSKWNHVIETLRTRLDLGKLELRVNLYRFNSPWDWREVDKEEVLDILVEVLKPLADLTGIHKPFLYLGYFENLKTKAEKVIMGVLIILSRKESHLCFTTLFDNDSN